MPSNLRTFYACFSAAFSICGANSFTASHGVQSVGVNTRFNLEQIFEIGQISLYEQIENIPDIEVTMQKVLDGYPLIYHQATRGATSATLSGRSNIKSTIGLSFFSDTQDSASGTPLRQCTISGVYPSAITYTFPTNGNCTEDVTLVGNNKIWSNSFTAPTFNNTDTPLASDGVQRRENVVFGSAGCTLPLDIPGISASGTNELSGGIYGAHIQQIRSSVNLGREQLFELGRRGPYHRYVTFPIEVTTDFEVISLEGDRVTALEDATSNLTDRTIIIKTSDGMILNLGTKNKLSSVTHGGANAGTNGGNATDTFTYTNFNDFTVTHPADPSSL